MIRKNDKNTLTVAQIIYPFMKCTDIYFLIIDIISLVLE